MSSVLPMPVRSQPTQAEIDLADCQFTIVRALTQAAIIRGELYLSEIRQAEICLVAERAIATLNPSHRYSAQARAVDALHESLSDIRQQMAVEEDHSAKDAILQAIDDLIRRAISRYTAIGVVSAYEAGLLEGRGR